MVENLAKSFDSETAEAVGGSTRPAEPRIAEPSQSNRQTDSDQVELEHMLADDTESAETYASNIEDSATNRVRRKSKAELEFFKDLVEIAVSLQRRAVEVSDAVLVERMQRLVIGMLHVHEILWAFRRCRTRPSIRHVADSMGLTPPGLQFRVRKLGLSADRFTQEDVTLQELIQQSEVLSVLVKLARRSYAEELKHV